MKLISLFADLSEFGDLLCALVILLYMWIRNHRQLSSKINGVHDKLDSLDQYSAKKLSQIMNKLDKDVNDLSSDDKK